MTPQSSALDRSPCKDIDGATTGAGLKYTELTPYEIAGGIG